MGNSMSKLAVLMLFALLSLSGLAMVGTVSAQSKFKPSVPEFTLKFVDKSSDVPPTTKTTTDPYTNKTTTTIIPGYHVKDQKIELTIKNQPYPTNIDGNKTLLTYHIQTKPHFSENWKIATQITQWLADGSGFTVKSFQADYRAGDQVDFRVQAILEYEYTSYIWTRLPVFGSDFGWYPENVTELYEASEWSPTQKFIMPETSQTLQLVAIIGTVVAVVAVSSGFLFYFKKRKH